MIASSRKPRSGRRLRRWREQRLYLARQRNEAKRNKERRWTSGVSMHDDDRIQPSELTAPKPVVDPVKAKKGVGLLGMFAALAGLASRPLRKKSPRGR